MLPFVCSASPSCSSQFPINFPEGSRKISLLWRGDVKCILEDKVFLGSQVGIHKHDIFFKPRATGYSQSLVLDAPECPSSSDSSIFSPYPKYFDDIVRHFPNESPDRLPEKWSCYAKELNASLPLDADPNRDGSGLGFVSDDVLSSNAGNAAPLSEPFEVQNEDIANLKDNVGDLLAGLRNSTTASVSSAQRTVEDAYDTLVSAIKKNVDGGADSMDNVISSFLSFFDKSKEQAGDKLTLVSSNMKGNFNQAGSAAADTLRRAIGSFESLLSDATTYVIYSYESVKHLFPQDLQEFISAAEGKLSLILNPIGTAFQKVYIVIEGLERNLGIDPNDPLVHLILLVAGSASFGVSFWLTIYGGYSGNLSPELTFELLKNEENAVLVDIRPEDLRERDGIPDLRRRARVKYASVNLPQVDGSIRKLLRTAGEVDDALIASIIRNLKIVQEGTNVIVLDAGGDQSKGIARSLRKLGVKNAYLVEGGFRSWVNSSLRIKELKAETALDFLNEVQLRRLLLKEKRKKRRLLGPAHVLAFYLSGLFLMVLLVQEAEAIIEEIKPTPLSIFGYGLGAAATLYALLEWEKTLQLIGVIGLGQSLYRRVSSYESSEDLRADVRLLLTPVTMGAQVLSRSSGNSDPTKIGLPTSPSSTAVQDRVIQAAAKHESQPSDSDEAQGQSTLAEPAAVMSSDGLDLSDA